MGVLYIISVKKSLDIVFEMASRENIDVTFLFIKDAYNLTENNELMNSLSYAAGIFCLEDVSNSRIKADNVQIINHKDWVKLIEENNRIVSWN